MFTILFTTICVLIILYAILYSLRDNETIAPIFNVIHPLVTGVVDNIVNALNWIATKIKSLTEK